MSTLAPARRLEPYTTRVHRLDDLARYVDLTSALPSGVTLVSATVQWAQRVNGVLTDRTDLFGSPSCTVNPASVPASGGGTAGGTGTILFQPTPSGSIPRGRYELLLTVTLSNDEVVTYGGVDDLSDWGDE